MSVTTQSTLLGSVGLVAALLTACATGPETRASGQPTAAQDAAHPPPATTVAQPAPAVTAASDTHNPFEYGTTQPVKPDVNPQVASVSQAMKTHDHPERLSPLIAPKPFDLVAYQKNPKAYLDVVEPGRVFQVAQPGPDVVRIQAMSPTQASISQGTTTVLQVHVPAGMPVSFTSFDLGRFQENQLTAITVAADDRGLAQVTFVGAQGTIGEVNILAGCPVTAGQVTYHIHVGQEHAP